MSETEAITSRGRERRLPLPSLWTALGRWPASVLFALAFTAAFAAKRPSQIFRAQLFAEDGVFVSDALAHGWGAVLSLRVGYLELFPRIASQFVVACDIHYWPLAANLSALGATFGLFLYAMRLRLPLPERLGGAALACLVPFGPEMYVNMTYFVVVPLMFYPLMLHDIDRGGRAAPRHHVLLAVVTATGPWPLFLPPVAMALWLGRRRLRGASGLALAHVVAFAVAGGVMLLSGDRGASGRAMPPAPFFVELVYDAMRGLFATSGAWPPAATLALTAVGTGGVLVCLARAVRRHQLLVAGVVAGAAALAGGIVRAVSTYPTVPPPHQPWTIGERYFVLLLSSIGLMVLATFWDALRERPAPRAASAAAALALALITWNGLANYSRPPLPDLEWHALVERSRAERQKEIAIPPGGVWKVRLP